MAKEIRVTVIRDSDGYTQSLTPAHADNLLKTSKFYRVLEDPRESKKEPKKRKDVEVEDLNEETN